MLSCDFQWKVLFIGGNLAIGFDKPRPNYVFRSLAARKGASNGGYQVRSVRRKEEVRQDGGAEVRVRKARMVRFIDDCPQAVEFANTLCVLLGATNARAGSRIFYIDCAIMNGDCR